MAADHVMKHHALAGEQVVKALRSRHFEACYCATKAEALQKALSYIPEGSTVGWGFRFPKGAMSAACARRITPSCSERKRSCTVGN